MYRKYRDPDFRPARAEMLERIRAHVKAVRETETADIEDSLGRVCAADILARDTLPNTAVAALDGIAVRFSDFANGAPDTRGWRENEEFCFANTGTAFDPRFDTVILVEEIDFEDGVLTIRTPPAERGAYVRAAGHTMRAGEVLVKAGSRLTPVHLGLMAAGGVLRPVVLKKPRIAVIPSGNELVPAGDPAPEGKNIESNSYMIGAFLREWGAVPVILPIARDGKAELVASLLEGLRHTDAVVLMAGSSKGTGDYAMEALAEVGEIRVHELAHGPGRHTGLTTAGDKPVFNLAGPSLGAAVAARLYLRPFVDALLGLPAHLYERVEATALHDFEAYDVDFCETLHVRRQGEAYVAESVPFQNATAAMTTEKGNAYFYHPAGVAIRKGERVFAELVVPRERVPDA